MKPLTIRTYNDPILKKVCEPYKVPEEKREALALLDRMKTLRKVGHVGVAGLAAPQIGVAKRLIMFVWGGIPSGMINPVITAQSDDRVIDIEGCLSYPNVKAQISRSVWVDVTWEGTYTQHQYRFHDFEARVIAHEVDHLNGVCLVGDAWRKAQKDA